LAGSAVDVVTITDPGAAVAVINRGGADSLWVSFTTTSPTVEGADCFPIPAGTWRAFTVPRARGVVVAVVGSGNDYGLELLETLPEPDRSTTAGGGTGGGGTGPTFWDGATDPAGANTVAEGDRWDEWGSALPAGAIIDPETLNALPATIPESALSFAIPTAFDRNFRRKLADHVLTTVDATVYATIAELDNPLEANHLYLIFATFFLLGGTAEDMEILPTIPAGAVIWGGHGAPALGASSVGNSQIGWAAWQGTDTGRYDLGMIGTAAGDVVMVRPSGLLLVGSTAGALTWQARLAAAGTGTDPTVKAGSHVLLLDLAGAD
jgi:hypothetical protein